MNKWNCKECKFVTTIVIPLTCDKCNLKPTTRMQLSKYLGIQNKVFWLCDNHKKEFLDNKLEL